MPCSELKEFAAGKKYYLPPKKNFKPKVMRNKIITYGN